MNTINLLIRIPPPLWRLSRPPRDLWSGNSCPVDLIFQDVFSQVLEAPNSTVKIRSLKCLNDFALHDAYRMTVTIHAIYCQQFEPQI